MTSRMTAAYAGDLSPQQAWDMLQREPGAVLVDVRSQPEWSFVGVPELSALGRRAIFVSWQHWTPGPRPAMVPNAAFAADLDRAGAPKGGPIIFLCRSGGRSKSAAIAMTALGYQRCYNLAGGFEGPHDAAQHRGTAAGWKATGLPWSQE